MNGYELLAEAHKKALKEDRNKFSEEDKKEIERKIEVFSALANFSEEDKNTAFDSGMFNDIYKGYVWKIMDTLSSSEDEEISKMAKLLTDSVRKEASFILNRMSAKDAEKYYHNGQI